MKCTTCQFLSVAHDHAISAYKESLVEVGAASDLLSKRNSGSVAIEQYFYARIQAATSRQRVESAWENLKRHGAEHELRVETEWEQQKRRGAEHEQPVGTEWGQLKRHALGHAN